MQTNQMRDIFYLGICLNRIVKYKYSSDFARRELHLVINIIQYGIQWDNVFVLIKDEKAFNFIKFLITFFFALTTFDGTKIHCFLEDCILLDLFWIFLFSGVSN